MGLVNDARLGLRAIRSLVRQRQARGVLQGKLAALEPLPLNRFEIGVYFAD